jgi:phosphatidylserine decarboxylase
VNLFATKGIADLFPRNERLIVLFERPSARLALVAVGAFNVGRISAEFDPGWNGPEGRGVTNRPASAGVDARVYEPALSVARGDEVMAFHFGSTVVLLVEGIDGAPIPMPDSSLHEGMEIRAGVPLLETPLLDSSGKVGPATGTGSGAIA